MSKIKWQDLAPDQLTWSEAILEIEGLVNAEVSDLRKKGKDFHTAHLIEKYLNIIKRGY